MNIMMISDDDNDDKDDKFDDVHDVHDDVYDDDRVK
jgi:hypothetical protein